MSNIWYRITSFLNDIKKINVTKETNDFIYINETRWMKHTSDIKYFKTINECIKWKISNFNEKIENLNSQIIYLKKIKQQFLDSLERIKDE